MQIGTEENRATASKRVNEQKWNIRFKLKHVCVQGVRGVRGVENENGRIDVSVKLFVLICKQCEANS